MIDIYNTDSFDNLEEPKKKILTKIKNFFIILFKLLFKLLGIIYRNICPILSIIVIVAISLLLYYLYKHIFPILKHIKEINDIIKNEKSIVCALIKILDVLKDHSKCKNEGFQSNNSNLSPVTDNDIFHGFENVGKDFGNQLDAIVQKFTELIHTIKLFMKNIHLANYTKEFNI